MKTTLVATLILFTLSLFILSPHPATADITKWGLPEGAVARLDKGWITGNIAYSPDGTRLAVASSIGIWLYDAQTGEEMDLFIGHTDTVKSVAFSPDGSTIASGSEDSTLRLWEVNTGTQIRTLTGHTGSVLGVAFSPDGNTIASGSSDDTIKLWDANTGTEIQTFEDWVSSVAFSPDGNTIASNTTLWDVNTGTEIRTLIGHGVAFSPDGSTIANGRGNTLKLWEVNTGNETRTFTGHTEPVLSVAFSPDGSTLASGSSDRTLKLWDVNTGNEIRTLTGHTDRIDSVAFSPDGQTLTSGSEDGTVRLWEVNTGNEIRTLTGHTLWVLGVAFSPDGNTLASRNRKNNTIKLWDVNTATEIRTLTGHRYSVTSVAFSPDGQTLASGSADETLKLWEVNTGTEIRTLTGHTSEVTSVAFSPDGNIIASGSADKTLKLWEVNTGTEIRTLTGHTSGVTSVAFSPDGNIIASGSADKTLKLWEVNTGTEIRTLIGNWKSVSSVTFSPDGSTLASDNKLWDVNTGTEIRTLTKNSLAFSPDGSTYASSSGGPLTLWEVNTGTEIQTLTGHRHLVYSVAFSPDGSTLASGSWDGTILLWDIFAAPSEPVGPTNIVAIADVAGAIAANVDGSYTVGGIVDASVPSPIVIFTTKLPAELTTDASVKLVQTAADGTETVIEGENDALDIIIDVGTLVNGTYMFHALAVDASGDVLTDASPQVTVHVANFRATDISGLTVIAVDGTAVSEPPTEPVSVRESITVRFRVANGALAAEDLNVIIEGSEVPSESTGDPENTFTLRVEVGTLVEGVYTPHGVVTKRNGSVAFPLLTINTDTTQALQTDVNDDGIVNIQDLVTVAAALGETGETPADVNGDGEVNIQDLVAVAAALGEAAAAPAVIRQHATAHLTAADVQQWIGQALQLDLTDSKTQRGIRFLEQLLAALTPKETALFANYPNPFNPETWIPYQLAKPADVTLTIYDIQGHVVRDLDLGHQRPGMYHSRARAAFWDGRNAVGEPVASGVYFYTLKAGDFAATRKMLIRK